jgi:hypothetical protein
MRERYTSEQTPSVPVGDRLVSNNCYSFRAVALVQVESDLRSGVEEGKEDW